MRNPRRIRSEGGVDDAQRSRTSGGGRRGWSTPRPIHHGGHVEAERRPPRGCQGRSGCLLRSAARPAGDRDGHVPRSRSNGPHGPLEKILADEALAARTIDADGQVAGHVGSWVNEHGAREISYWLGRGYWGKGIATQAVAQLVELLHERPLYAGVAEHNVASMRVLEKCGFTRLQESTLDHPPIRAAHPSDCALQPSRRTRGPPGWLSLASRTDITRRLMRAMPRDEAMKPADHR
jgi:GNAT superfamily N-acetyltransferase